MGWRGRVHCVAPFGATKQQKCPKRRNGGDGLDGTHSSALPSRIQKHTSLLVLIRRGPLPGAIHSFLSFVSEFSARRNKGGIPIPSY